MSLTVKSWVFVGDDSGFHNSSLVPPNCRNLKLWVWRTVKKLDYWSAIVTTGISTALVFCSWSLCSNYWLRFILLKDCRFFSSMLISDQAIFFIFDCPLWMILVEIYCSLNCWWTTCALHQKASLMSYWSLILFSFCDIQSQVSSLFYDATILPFASIGVCWGKVIIWFALWDNLCCWYGDARWSQNFYCKKLLENSRTPLHLSPESK